MSLARKNNVLKLKPLPPKGTIAVTAPASPPDQSKLQNGITYLEKLGYTVKIGKTCYTEEAYLAGSDEQRALELMNFYADPEVDAIFCARGGFGSMGLLPLLDYKIIRESRKLLVGFSDITALEWGIFSKTSLPALSAGMVATDMGSIPIDEDFENHFWEVLNNGKLNIELPFETESEQVINGIGFSGTISVASKLSGTPYFPEISDGILIFEDVHEYRHKIDGLLQHFKLSGLYEKCRAILFGEFVPADDENQDELPDINEMYQRIFRNLDIPIITNVSYGHIKKKVPMPVGLPVELKLGPKSFLKTQDPIYES